MGWGTRLGVDGCGDDGCVEGSFDIDDDNDYDNDGNQPVLLQSVCCGSHEYRRLGNKQLECPMIKDDIPMISAK